MSFEPEDLPDKTVDGGNTDKLLVFILFNVCNYSKSLRLEIDSEVDISVSDLISYLRPFILTIYWIFVMNISVFSVICYEIFYKM